VPLVLEIAAQLGEALLQVHTAGVVHADIKPENIFATHRGKYVLLDFSTARSYYEPETWRPSLATVSPGYSPLEQYTREQKLTRAADVYALAATLYTLLIGQPPPDAPSRSRGTPLADLSHLPAEIQKALREALHLHPLRRTSSIGIFLEQLGLPPNRAPVVSLYPFQQTEESYAHPGGVYALALRAESNILCSAGRDGCFRLWSWPECQLLRPQKVVNSPLKALALSRDGLHLLTGAHDGSIRLWATREVADGPWLVRQGPPVVSLRFDPLDRFIAAGFADGNCRLLGPTGALDIRWQAHPGAVHALDINSQGTLLATVGDDAQVKLWNLPDGTRADWLELPESANSVRFHQNGLYLLTAARDHAVRLWDLQTRREANKFVADRADVWDAQFTSDPNTIVTLSADHHLYGFRLDTGHLTHGTMVSGGLTGAMVVDRGRRMLAVGGSDGQISTWTF
jgi:WD40 repeat protein